jgi:hypothetical protein
MNEDPVEYTVKVTHWCDGTIITQVTDVGDSEEDRAAVAWALRSAALQVEGGNPVSTDSFS